MDPSPAVIRLDPTNQITISVLGSLNTDIVVRVGRQPAAGETLTAQSVSFGCGGKGANQAVAIRRMTTPSSGRPITTSATTPTALSKTSTDKSVEPAQIAITTRMVGAIGSDVFGARLLDQLKQDGIDVSGVKPLDGIETGTAIITVDDAGQNSIMVVPGANGQVGQPGAESKADNLVVLSGDEDVLVCQLEVPKPVVIANLRAAAAKNVVTIVNPSPAIPLTPDELALIDILVVNETETAILSKLPPSSLDNVTDPSIFYPHMDAFISAGVEHVIVTRGIHGSIYACKSRPKERKVFKATPVPSDKVVDTTCAGDTFLGLIAATVAASIGRARRRSRCSGRDASGDFAADVEISDRMSAAIRLAHQAASLAIQKPGAIASIPKWQDLIASPVDGAEGKPDHVEVEQDESDVGMFLPFDEMKWPVVKQ